MVPGGDVEVGPSGETEREQLGVMRHGGDVLDKTAMVLGNCKSTRVRVSVHCIIYEQVVIIHVL